MTEDTPQNEFPQQVPRKVRLTSKGVLYVLLALALSAACVSFMIHLLLLVDREKHEWTDLTRELKLRENCLTDRQTKQKG